METFRCEPCGRDFASQEGLDQHNRDKHELGGQSNHELRQLKKQERERQQGLERKKMSRSKLIKRSSYIVIPILLLTAAFTFISSQPATTSNVIASSEIPKLPIHWHPKLTVQINGQQQTIPANLGLVGVHQPIHTHDSTGVLHYENNNPTVENMRLGYFFEKVWRKQFNSRCILNYCNSDSGTVKMFVNEKENFDFDNYIPKDKDDILIEFS
jgi:hypothetical protein